MRMLFENRRQALKVRIVLWVSLVVCAGALYGGWAIMQTYGLSPADGGVLRPFGERLALGGFVAVLGLAFAGGMMLFATIYVLRLARDGDQVVIDTLTLWGIGGRRHSFAISDIGESAYHHGRFSVARETGTPGQLLDLNVDAPWITLHAAGRRLPFLLDLQAEIVDISALAALAKGAVSDWQEDGG